jgi:dipeptidyl aminopeptidase/acylaminoacyl peptidase
MRILFFFTFLCLATDGFAQKKPLDHTVYDRWERIGESVISTNGQWIGYVKAVQEGDDEANIVSADGSKKTTVPRGYNVKFTKDNRFAVMMIKPFFAATREAKIKKKKADDMPKDSLAIIDLSTGNLRKIPNVKTYSLPTHAPGPLAYHAHKVADTSKKAAAASDSDEGTDLYIDPLYDTLVSKFANISEYKWNPKGKMLVMEGRQSAAVKGSSNSVLIYRTAEAKLDTILKGGNEFGNFAIDSIAYQIAFTAERDSSKKSLQKFHKLWYYRNGMDSAVILAEKNTEGMKLGWTVSEHRDLRFSGNGSKLFFGTAPIRPPKDTLTPDIDKVKVDVWNYKDDYLQTVQLFNLNADLKRNYLAVYHLNLKKVMQLADEGMRDVMLPSDGDGELYVGISDTGRRVQSQWTGTVLKDFYAIDASTGKKTLISKNNKGFPQLSSSGHYISWYDVKARQFFTWRSNHMVNVSKGIPYKLYDEEDDHPDDPSPYGRMSWMKDDKGLLVEDKYDIWKLDPDGKIPPVPVTKGMGRKLKTDFSPYESRSSNDEDPYDQLIVNAQDESTKKMGVYVADLSGKNEPAKLFHGPYFVGPVSKAAEAGAYMYTKQSVSESPDLYVLSTAGSEHKITALNPQQSDYNWSTAELVRWTAYDGKEATGILFKPENFDPSKKYPMICYFYEKSSKTLYNYRSPAPTPSALNIVFFASRGYLVFVPDISYKVGYPGKGAHDYVVSGARAMVKKGFVDSTKIGLQGQSWGGYQICHIITRTKLFAAAWAGAPVANMTSAYGGIRWESGVTRQFQYEKSQSRIGATLWEKPQLYIENSPLFHLPKVTTPLMIMSNDDDGAVPWYQGIELFTAMRRLGKQVWLLNYNGEKHNLVERKNRKDLSVREQEFFDWLLKGEKPARWLSDGVPAIEKQ